MINRVRQQDLVNSEIFNNDVNIVGCGAVGSFTALTLSKMGFSSMKLWDNDVVDEVNISNQFYRSSDVGSSKVEALTSIISAFGDSVCNTKVSRISKEEVQSCTGVLISAVDNIQSREQMFKWALKSKLHWFIDARMGGQQAEVFCIKLGRLGNKSQEFYKSSLFSASEASPLPCTQKAVMYNVLWIASAISNILRLALEERDYPVYQLHDFNNCSDITMRVDGLVEFSKEKV